MKGKDYFRYLVDIGRHKRLSISGHIDNSKFCIYHNLVVYSWDRFMIAWIHVKYNRWSSGSPTSIDTRHPTMGSTYYRQYLKGTTFEWIKDGISFWSPHLSGYVDVFKPQDLFVKGYFCIPLQVLYAFETKLTTTTHVVIYVTTFKWKRFWS